jgi:hypothetical protein
MFSDDSLTLCEHDREPGNCPICAEEEAEGLLDPLTRAVADRVQRPDEVVELTGVPFS